MEWVDMLRFAAALLFVLGLIGLAAMLAKRFGLAGPAPINPAKPAKRLQVIERIALGGKQQLVLLRRDDTDHLILVGGEHALLVESGIENRKAAVCPRADQALQTIPAHDAQSLPGRLQKVVHMMTAARS